ncbi:MAG: hypothetical protein KME12_26465 [Trichocoleus desertorum ATA4-8-CV12]|nr:hypothetical protein [Trichocoleus desertorum ATA4-8-CV12]
MDISHGCGYLNLARSSTTQRSLNDFCGSIGSELELSLEQQLALSVFASLLLKLNSVWLKSGIQVGG